MTTASAQMNETENTPDQAAPTGGSYDDINVPVVLMVGVISVIVTIATIFFVQGLCYQWHNGFIRERSYDYVNEPVRAMVEDQKNLLNGNVEGIKSLSLIHI